MDTKWTCPICGKPSNPRFRPFCDARCADIDLGRWLTGQYRTPISDEDAEDTSGDRVDPPRPMR